MVPVLIGLALISLSWFGLAVWVATRGRLAEAYFPVFMGVLFSVAVWLNYRTYRTRVMPFTRTPTVLDGLPSFGTYEPGGPPATTGNRWWNWVRYSIHMRIVGIFVFGGMILLYDAGGQLFGAWKATPGVRVAREAQIPPVTESSPGDASIQSDLIHAAATAREAYVADHGSFNGVTWGVMDAQPGNHLSFTNVASPPGTQTISFSAEDAVATLAGWGGDNDNVCWFARVDMQVNGGAQPGGLQFQGMKSFSCVAVFAPSSGWADGFPPAR